MITIYSWEELLRYSPVPSELGERFETCPALALFRWLLTSRCAAENCSMTPSYGLPGSGKRGFCVQHAGEGMVKLNRKMCSFRGCFLVATYGDEGSNRKQFCLIHAAQGMVLVSGKKCGRAECFKRATYGAAGGRKREYCAQHAKGSMVNVDSRKCVGPGCNKRATYGLEDGPRRYCAGHADRGMIDIANKECLREFCPKRARYGAEGSGRRDFCLQHAEDGMVNFDSKRCLARDCAKSPTFGVAGTSRRQYCAEHALPGHVNVAHKPCIRPGCAKRAAYGMPGTKAREYCAEHAKGGMVRQVAPRYEGNESAEESSSGSSLVSGVDGISAADQNICDDMEIVPSGGVSCVNDGRVKTIVGEATSDSSSGVPLADGNEASASAETVPGVEQRYPVSAAEGNQLTSSTVEGYAGIAVTIRPPTTRGAWSPDATPLLQTPSGWSKWNWQAAMVGPSTAFGL